MVEKLEDSINKATSCQDLTSIVKKMKGTSTWYGGRKFTKQDKEGEVSLSAVIQKAEELLRHNDIMKADSTQLNELVNEIKKLDRNSSGFGISGIRWILNKCASYDREKGLDLLDAVKTLRWKIKDSTYGFIEPNVIKSALEEIRNDYRKKHPGEQVPMDFISELKREIPFPEYWKANAAKFASALMVDEDDSYRRDDPNNADFVNACKKFREKEEFHSEEEIKYLDKYSGDTLYAMGLAHERGSSDANKNVIIPVNKQTAIELFTLAANRGNVKALIKLREIFQAEQKEARQKEEVEEKLIATLGGDTYRDLNVRAFMQNPHDQQNLFAFGRIIAPDSTKIDIEETTALIQLLKVNIPIPQFWQEHAERIAEEAYLRREGHKKTDPTYEALVAALKQPGQQQPGEPNLTDITSITTKDDLVKFLEKFPAEDCFAIAKDLSLRRDLPNAKVYPDRVSDCYEIAAEKGSMEAREVLKVKKQLV